MLDGVTYLLLSIVGSYLPLLLGNLAFLYWPVGQPKAPPPLVTRHDWVRVAKNTAKQLGLIWAIVAATTVAALVVMLLGN